MQTASKTTQTDYLKNIGIDTLNPMQEETIAKAETIPNLMLLAPTGSGKTLAFLLPFIAWAAVRVAASGALNSLEFRDPRASAEPMAQLINATGGGVQVYEEAGWPTLRRVSAQSERSGRGWFGLKQNQDYVVTGIDQSPLVPAWVALLLSLGAVLLAWKREGR